MVVNCHHSRSDDLSSWNVNRSLNNNEIENVDDEERSIALSVSLLLKNRHISRANLVRLPSHLVTSPNCQCHRSFHIFCTDLFHENDQSIQMINTHPAPRNHERDSSRRISTPYKKHRRRHHDHNDQDTIVTTRSEPCHGTILESQLLEKKLRVPPKLPPRTVSLNIPLTYRTFQNSLKYPPTIRATKQPTSMAQLQIHALSVFDQSYGTSQFFSPRGPPPSPKTPTQETSTILFHSVHPAPLRAIPIIPRLRSFNESPKKSTHISSLKTTNYEDHAREYLSASDCSDNDEDVDNDEDLDKILKITKPKLPLRTQSLSRPGTALRDRILSHNANRYLSFAQVYYSSLDVYKNLAEKSRQRLRSQARLIVPPNETDDTSTIITKTTTTTKTTPPISQSKSVFGFSKTASSMHFGHAAGRLGLQGRFEKWPQPLSRRTPIERKQEVTTLRLVTLPLVTS